VWKNKIGRPQIANGKIIKPAQLIHFFGRDSGEQLRFWLALSLRKKLSAGYVGDLCLRELRLHSFQDADGVRGTAVVVAQENSGLIGE
jgi:hypothetical protein